MPLLSVSMRGRETSGFGAVRRFGLALTVSAWVFVVGLAVMIFSGQVAWNINLPNIIQREILGFAYAFTVAGTIAGFVALAVLGEWRRAWAFAVIGLVFLGISVLTLRWLVFRVAGPNGGWTQRWWGEDLERIGLSLALGSVIALVVSALVIASRPLARRMAAWKFGLVVVVAAYVLGYWGFPLMISHLTERALPHLRWNYGYRYDEALQGAAIGSGPGALAGAIVVSLMARWLGTPKGSEPAIRGALEPTRPSKPQS